jgi:pyruvate kinase
MALAPGQTVLLAPEEGHSPGEIPTTYRFLAQDLRPGDRVLLDDGTLAMVCIRTDGDRAEMEVTHGGLLRSRKGINLPGVKVRERSLTEKDLDSLELALDMEAEFIGLSFVRGPQDVEDLKSRVGGRAKIVAKIEKAEALEAIHEIIQLANRYARGVITATQMLESMIDGSRPTRAEASDVANAILDGTGAVMLSGETAVGKNPLKALEALVRIAKEIDECGALADGPRYLPIEDLPDKSGASLKEHAVASASVEAVRTLGASAIIALTRTGFTAQLLASYRPPVPILAVCTEPLVYRQLWGVWGVQPFLEDSREVTYDQLLQVAREAALRTGVGEPGDSVVVTAGTPFHTAGSTNTMRVERL